MPIESAIIQLPIFYSCDMQLHFTEMVMMR